MGIAILLRTEVQTNYFGDLMVRTLTQGCGDSIVLCSGFFQENFRGHSYQVSNENGLINVLRQNRINVTTIGVHNNVWKDAYVNFVNNLRNGGVNVTAYVTSSLRWHAKVFILKREGRPVFGIVGSSNMTRNAFGTTNPFNYEADTFLWVSDECGNLVSDYVKSREKPEDAIFTRYHEDDNNDLTIQQRLEYLEEQVMNTRNLRVLD